MTPQPSSRPSPDRAAEKDRHAAVPKVAPRLNIAEGRGHYIGAETISPHSCRPPLVHAGCCDGTGGSTITEESTRHPTHPMPAEMVGRRTVCIDGRPVGDDPYWVCDDCGTGWRIAPACYACRTRGGHGSPPRGMHTVGTAWVEMSPRELRRVKRRARR